MSKIIGIIGGMGPEATCDLFRKIIERTDAKCDQEHLHVIIDNNTSIPDRTAHILGKGPSPEDELVRTAGNLEAAGAEILIMPCNTAHSYYETVKARTGSEFLNMIEETASFIASEYPASRSVGLLATTGTYASGIYTRALAKRGISLIEPSRENKELVLKWIYNMKAGKKDVPQEELSAVFRDFDKNGAKVIILGCTELPVLFEVAAENIPPDFSLVDATEVLAMAAVSLAKGDGQASPDAD